MKDEQSQLMTPREWRESVNLKDNLDFIIPISVAEADERMNAYANYQCQWLLDQLTDEKIERLVPLGSETIMERSRLAMKMTKVCYQTLLNEVK